MRLLPAVQRLIVMAVTRPRGLTVCLAAILPVDCRALIPQRDWGYSSWGGCVGETQVSFFNTTKKDMWRGESVHDGFSCTLLSKLSRWRNDGA